MKVLYRNDSKDEAESSAINRRICHSRLWLDLPFVRIQGIGIISGDACSAIVEMTGSAEIIRILKSGFIGIVIITEDHRVGKRHFDTVQFAVPVQIEKIIDAAHRFFLLALFSLVKVIINGKGVQKSPQDQGSL